MLQLYSLILEYIEISRPINLLQHQKDLRTALEPTSHFSLDQLLLFTGALKQGRN